MKEKKLECIDGETLMDMRLESIRYCVEGFLPQGVAMIGGVPKTGNLCRAKAMESVSSISVMIPEVTAVTLMTAKLTVSKLPSLPFLSSLFPRSISASAEASRAPGCPPNAKSRAEARNPLLYNSRR